MDISVEEIDEIAEPNWKERKQIFAMLIAANLLLNYDTGVIPASLIQMESEISLTYQEKAVLGALVYLGLCIASIVVPAAFHRFCAQKVIVTTLALNCCFCLVFSLSSSVGLMYVARFGMGFTQAFTVIYAPVWTNEHAPSQSVTRWMGVLQAAVPFGIVLGYAMTGMFIYMLGDLFTWRLSIQLQAVFEIPVIVKLYYSDPQEVDALKLREQNSIIEDVGQLPNFCIHLKRLASNWIFILLTLSLCSLYFVITGLQYWMTSYMIQILDADPVNVVITFVIICTTAPVAGVFTGGTVVDYIGGYKGQHLSKAVTLCLSFGVLSSVFAVSLMFADSLALVAPLAWFLMFFGGCLLPTATGINVNALEKEFRSSASSVSQLIFNLGGYFMAPVASAAVMDSFGDKDEGMIWGFRFVLMVSFLGIAFISMARVVAQRQHAVYTEFNEIDELDAEQIDVAS